MIKDPQAPCHHSAPWQQPTSKGHLHVRSEERPGECSSTVPACRCKTLGSIVSTHPSPQKPDTYLGDKGAISWPLAVYTVSQHVPRSAVPSRVRSVGSSFQQWADLGFQRRWEGQYRMKACGRSDCNPLLWAAPELSPALEESGLVVLTVASALFPRRSLGALPVGWFSCLWCRVRHSRQQGRGTLDIPTDHRPCPLRKHGHGGNSWHALPPLSLRVCRPGHSCCKCGLLLDNALSPQLTSCPCCVSAVVHSWHERVWVRKHCKGRRFLQWPWRETQPGCGQQKPIRLHQWGLRINSHSK